MNFLGRLASALAEKTAPRTGTTELLEKMEESLKKTFQKKKIYIGADHAGFELKEALKEFLKAEGYEVEDKGAFFYDPDDDYPDLIFPVAEAVAGDPESRGIVIGGSGQAEAIVANRVRGVRAAVFYATRTPLQAADISGRQSTDPFEIIRLSREHDDANVLSLAARFISEEEAKKAVLLWLETPFSGGRHERRLKRIDGG